MSNKLKQKYDKKEMLRAIAVFKAENPAITIYELAKKFNVKYHQARYAIDKYSKDISLLKGNSKGRITAAKILSENLNEVELLKKQLAFIIAQVDVNDKIPAVQRIDLLSKIAKIKKLIQEFELESHLKRADANIIAAIIKRFLPDATNDDIIKIYYEELKKIKQNLE